MRRGSKALDSDSRDDQLAWLVLQVVAKLSPCTTASLIARISGGDASASDSPTRELVSKALLKLEALALIRTSQEGLEITDEGKRFLDELPSLPPRMSSCLTALKALVLALPADRLSWLKWKDHFTRAHAVARALQTKVRRVRAAASQSLKSKVAPLAARKANSLPHMLERLARIRRTLRGTSDAILGDWQWRVGTALRKSAEASGVLLRVTFAGRRRAVMLGGALLALSTVGGIALLLEERVEDSQGFPAALSIGRVERPSSTANAAWTEAVRSAIQSHLSELTVPGKPQKREHGALVEYYSAPAKPLLWVDENGLTERAKSVMDEIARADDYGLRATDYELPKPDDNSEPNDGAGVDRLADAEVKLDFAVLRYAHDARGGRIEPSRLTAYLDPTLALPDPLEILNTISVQAKPAIYLRSFHPSHPQFEALREKLLELRRSNVAERQEAKIEIPPGLLLKLGVADPQISLLRQRLQIPSGDNPNRFDEAVLQAVRAFQAEHNAAVDGMVGPGTRQLLNTPDAGRALRIKTILLNMERWRWLPQDRDGFYVTVNVPEFTLRVVDNGETIYTTRVVVGKPDTQTPIFSDEMETVVFGPYWHVPNSIKVEEIRPYLRQELWFFGGWNTSILRHHNLRVKYGGREVDPETLDWDRIDIRSLHIYQPPGPNNVLGKVKFLFPNKHDVYLHDTLEKNLFAQQVRAESHGCVRVENPDQFALLILKHDQGWSEARTKSAMENGYDQRVALNQAIPVHITYFTARVNDDGLMSTFHDLYGHDARMAAALFGDSEGFAYPTQANEVRENRAPRGNPLPWGRAASNDIVGSIIRLLNN